MSILHFTPSPSPIREPITKFGGQPVWLREPAWPISRSTRKPMRFVAQIRLPASMQSGGHQIAYVFMTNEDVDNTWDPEAGENAVILQPGPFTPIVDTQPLATGPSLLARRVIPPTFWEKIQGKRGREVLEPVELAVVEAAASTREHATTSESDAFQSRIGGNPEWLQSEEFPPQVPDANRWLFLAQIDSTSPAFDINFGDGGVAYIFVSECGTAARMLWQCL